MSRNFKRFMTRHCEPVRLIFDFLLRSFVCLEYFTGDSNFNEKFVKKGMFLRLGPYGPPLTTNGRTEDFDHVSVKVPFEIQGIWW